MLGKRQRLLYTDRVRIFQRRNSNTTQATYTQLYDNIPCKIQYTINVDSPAVIASFKEKSMFTMDTIHLPLVDDSGRTLNIPNGALFLNITPNNPNRLTLAIAMGAVNILPGNGHRAALNKQQVNVMTEEKVLQDPVLKAQFLLGLV